MTQKQIEVLVTDQPKSVLESRELISKTRRKIFHREISKLVEEQAAEFLGRGWNQVNGAVYQIFTIEGKRIFVEDPDASSIMDSLFDTDGRIREIEMR